MIQTPSTLGCLACEASAVKLLKPLDHLISQGLIHQPFHFSDPCRAGDIDFTQHPADHIDAHEEQPFSPQGRCQC